jgi:hypothetical protein
MNISKQIIESIKTLYKSIRMQIKGSGTGWFKIGRGVPQGSALSGLIFTICLAPILRRIRNDATIPNLGRKDNGIRVCNKRGKLRTIPKNVSQKEMGEVHNICRRRNNYDQT